MSTYLEDAKKSITDLIYEVDRGDITASSISSELGNIKDLLDYAESEHESDQPTQQESTDQERNREVLGGKFKIVRTAYGYWEVYNGILRTHYYKEDQAELICKTLNKAQMI